MEFRPLDQYGDWVAISTLLVRYCDDSELRRETNIALREQIDAVIPNIYRYRKCINFKETDHIDTMERVISWLYCPDINVMSDEIHAIGRSLNG